MSAVPNIPSAQAGPPLEKSPNPFTISRVCSSKNFPPLKILIFGVPGIGKTTFATTFPKPILLRTEDGANAIDCPTFPAVAKTFFNVQDAITALGTQKHDFKTLIIDSLDWLEPIIWQEVIETVPLKNGEKAQNIESYGFGKGYVAVDSVWRNLTKGLEWLRETTHMNIVAIAHAVAVVIDPPDSDPYQKYSLKLHKRGAAIWTEWADLMLFCNYAQKVVKSKNEMQKAKAFGTGDRIIYTTERPAYFAKSRWSLPDEILIGKDEKWSAFHAALNEASGGIYTNINNQNKR